MQYISYYQSPLGNILLSANNNGLSGLWFEGQKYFALTLDKEHQEKEMPLFKQVKNWLDNYFLGNKPNSSLPLYLIGTNFQKQVWQILYSIPYGETRTYGEIAKELAIKKGLSRMSAQAVGSAVGHNPISIIIPCHRVMGENGDLRGYAGGIEKKVKLLELEKVNTQPFTLKR